MMATSEMSRSSRSVGATPATYICPKLSGTIAAGVVFLGVMVFMLIPRTDNSKPVVYDSGLSNSPESEVSPPIQPAPSPSVPEVSVPEVSSDDTDPELVRIDKGSPEEPGKEPAVEPAAVDVPGASDGEDDEIEPPEGHPNVLRVMEGYCPRSRGGDKFHFRDADGKNYVIQLAGVLAPISGAGIALRGKINRKQVRVECIADLDDGSIVGWATVDGESVNEFMVGEGKAWYDPRMVTSPKLEQLQEQARAAHRGIWKNGDVEPPFSSAPPRTPSEEHAADSTSNAAVDSTPANTTETTQARQGGTASPTPSEPPKGRSAVIFTQIRACEVDRQPISV